MSPPPRIQMDLPVRKNVFGTGRKRYINHQLFYVIFIEKMYIKAKSKESISGQNWNAYIKASLLHKKLQKNRFYESLLLYKGENDEKLTRPENLNLNSRGGGNKLHKDGNRLETKFKTSLKMFFSWPVMYIGSGAISK